MTPEELRARQEARGLAIRQSLAEAWEIEKGKFIGRLRAGLRFTAPDALARLDPDELNALAHWCCNELRAREHTGRMAGIQSAMGGEWSMHREM